MSSSGNSVQVHISPGTANPDSPAFKSADHACHFPDADRDGAFTLPSTVDQQAPQFQHAMRACVNMQPSSLSINQAPASP